MILPFVHALFDVMYPAIAKEEFSNSRGGGSNNLRRNISNGGLGQSGGGQTIVNQSFTYCRNITWS